MRSKQKSLYSSHSYSQIASNMKKCMRLYFQWNHSQYFLSIVSTCESSCICGCLSLEFTIDTSVFLSHSTPYAFRTRSVMETGMVWLCYITPKNPPSVTAKPMLKVKRKVLLYLIFYVGALKLNSWSCITGTLTSGPSFQLP